MNQAIIECVPNISEGRDKKIIDKIVDSIEQSPHCLVLSVEPDADYNRTVVTIAGKPDEVYKAAYQLISSSIEPLIDFNWLIEILFSVVFVDSYDFNDFIQLLMAQVTISVDFFDECFCDLCFIVALGNVCVQVIKAAMLGESGDLECGLDVHGLSKLLELCLFGIFI